VAVQGRSDLMVMASANPYNVTMLRIIVIGLFVANLLLLGFQLSEPPARPQPNVSQSVVDERDIPTIHLVSELMQDWHLMSGNRKCFSLGPFHSREDRDEVRGRLAEASAYISERQTQAQVEKGYWVFLPPYQSILEANQKLLSLQALGFKDVEVIYQGEWVNTISLGYFLRQKNAQKRIKSFESRGYTPSMRVQRQTEPRYWLDYEQNPGSGLITLTTQDRPTDFMQRSVPCPQDGLPASENEPETHTTIAASKE